MKQFCTVVALIILASCQRATEFTVHFRNAHGLKEGAAVVYRGLDVGKVLSVTLAGNGVDAKISATPETANQLYREATYMTETVGDRSQITVHDAGQGRTAIRSGDIVEGTEPLTEQVKALAGDAAAAAARAARRVVDQVK